MELEENLWKKLGITVLTQLVPIISFAIFWLLDDSKLRAISNFFLISSLIFSAIIIIIVISKWVGNYIYWLYTLIPLTVVIFYLLLFPFKILRFGDAPFATTAVVLPILLAVIFTVFEGITCFFVWLIKK